MNSKVVEINCWCDFFNFDSLPRHLSSFDEYKCSKLGHSLVVDLKIAGESIRINLTFRRMKNVHVCLGDWWMDCSNKFKYRATRRAKFYETYFPDAPIIIVCYHAQLKFAPGKRKQAELEGDKMMSKEIGDKLAGEVGAVKYIEYSEETGRGAKILIDEIAFAGIGKIRDGEKRREKAKCNIM